MSYCFQTEINCMIINTYEKIPPFFGTSLAREFLRSLLDLSGYDVPGPSEAFLDRMFQVPLEPLCLGYSLLYFFLRISSPF